MTFSYVVDINCCPHNETHKNQYFPVDNAHLLYNAHPVFSVLTNFLNIYRAPENTWNRTTGCGQARI
jgi:hypothetical protein